MRHVSVQTKVLLINIARKLRSAGRGQKATVLALLGALRERSVVLLRDGVMLPDDEMEMCHRWADDHVGLLVTDGLTSKVHGKRLLNVARQLLRGVWPNYDVGAAFDSSIIAGLDVSFVEEGVGSSTVA